jgi:hypothetical protein
MRNTKEALIWITDILKNSNIPFQISGGLAARAYGATRDLLDIDIEIPEDKFICIQDKIRNFLVFGPRQFREKPWDLMLMTLQYKNQEIDICGAYKVKIFNKITEKWITLTTDFSNSVMLNVLGIEIPVIPLEDLVAYKKVLAREVDIIDINQIKKNR